MLGFFFKHSGYHLFGVHREKTLAGNEGQTEGYVPRLMGQRGRTITVWSLKDGDNQAEVVETN